MRQGTLVADRFCIDSRIGAGGMGVVYRAVDRHLGDTVALKILVAFESRERFLREASVLERVRHPNVVRYVAHGVTEEGQPYLAMEWVDGETLAARLQAGPLAEPDALRVAEQVAAALGAAHAVGVVHRDVKPGNILLAGGSVDAVKVLDFGIARVLAAEAELTRASVVIGTPAYMAPEQARASHSVDARADVFSLGAVLFRCLAGRAPFGGGDVRVVLAKLLFDDAPRLADVAPAVTPAVDKVVARMPSRDPAERFADGAAAREALRQLLARPSEEPTTQLGRRWQTTSLSRRELGLVGVVMTTRDFAKGESTPSSAAVRVLAGGVGEQTLHAIRAAGREHGARVEALADGSIVAVLSGEASAKAQAIRMARCALSLAAVLPGMPLAAVVGQALVGTTGVVGAALEAAGQLLTRAVARDGPVVDDAFAALLDERFELEARDGHFVLRRERPEALGARTLIGKATRCVGRRRELAVLRATYEECAEEGVARAVVVTAPAGMGKSRLRCELLRDIDGAGVWMARGDPAGIRSPLGALVTPLRRAAGLLTASDRAPAERLRAHVRSLVAAEDRERVAEFLAVLLEIPIPGPESERLRAARYDSGLMGEQIRRAVEDLASAACQRGPLLIVVDDLQWVDPATIDCLNGLLGSLADRPLMVLALGRPEALERFPRLFERRSPHHIVLPPLSARAGMELAREVLGGSVPDEEVQRIVEQSEGNAYFLEELLRAAGRGERSLPASLLAMAQARLGALDEEDRRLLRAASLFGEAFWTGGVAALAAMPRAEVKARLHGLAAAELVVHRASSRIDGEEEFTLWHPLLREAAYGILTAEDRQLGHALAAQWLRDREAASAAVLAHHYEAAGDGPRATECLVRAATEALERNDFAGVIDLAERGMALGATGESLALLHRARQAACRWTGEWEQSERHGRLALQALPPGSAAWLLAVSDLAFALAARRRLPELAALSHELAGALREPLDLAQVRAIIAVGGAQLWVRDGDRGQRLLSRLDALAPDVAEDVRVAARLGWVRAQQAVERGALDEAREHTDRAVRGFERAGETRNAIRERISAATVALLLGLWDEARAEAERGLEQARALRLRALALTARECRALALLRSGDAERARALFADSAAEHATRGDTTAEGRNRAHLAEALLALGSPEALGEALRAEELCREAPREHLFALSVLADAQLRRGPSDELADTVARIERGLESLGHWEERAAVIARWVRALDALGRSGDASRWARSAWNEVLERAKAIADIELRASFLARVPEHRALSRRAELP